VIDVFSYLSPQQTAELSAFYSVGVTGATGDTSLANKKMPQLFIAVAK